MAEKMAEFFIFLHIRKSQKNKVYETFLALLDPKHILFIQKKKLIIEISKNGWFLADFCKNGWIFETEIGRRYKFCFSSIWMLIYDFYWGLAFPFKKYDVWLILADFLAVFLQKWLKFLEGYWHKIGISFCINFNEDIWLLLNSGIIT